jgi:hypothetical protein
MRRNEANYLVKGHWKHRGKHPARTESFCSNNNNNLVRNSTIFCCCTGNDVQHGRRTESEMGGKEERANGTSAGTLLVSDYSSCLFPDTMDSKSCLLS